MPTYKFYNLVFSPFCFLDFFRLDFVSLDFNKKIIEF